MNPILFFLMSILFTNWTPKNGAKNAHCNVLDDFFVTFDKRQKATALNDVFGAILRMPDYILYILTIIFHQRWEKFDLRSFFSPIKQDILFYY